MQIRERCVYRQKAIAVEWDSDPFTVSLYIFFQVHFSKEILEGSQINLLEFHILFFLPYNGSSKALSNSTIGPRQARGGRHMANNPLPASLGLLGMKVFDQQRLFPFCFFLVGQVS